MEKEPSGRGSSIRRIHRGRKCRAVSEDESELVPIIIAEFKDKGGLLESKVENDTCDLCLSIIGLFLASFLITIDLRSLLNS